MTRIEIISEEIKTVKKQTDRLINKIPTELWMVSPTLLNTNLNWQIGHVFLANYLHGIASISGPSPILRKMINVKEFVKFYGLDSDPLSYTNEKPSKEKILTLYNYGFELIFKELEKLKDTDLDKPTEIPNPGAKTKYQALMWLFKHQSWHNGQIAILIRVLNKKKQN